MSMNTGGDIVMEAINTTSAESANCSTCHCALKPKTNENAPSVSVWCGSAVDINSTESVHTGNISSEHAMTFKDVGYEVRGLSKCHWTTKTILSNVSGVMVPGVNAIMGPTGGGKTTLLDILAQRKGTSGLSQTIRGTVLLNGEQLPDDFNLRTGYVVQDDILEGILTVRENLLFSAALRLPRSTSNKERTERVQHIIHQLGLISCADTVIGTEFIRGVSGGERKRTVIGMELIIDPIVLFMDEPTTGLDAHTVVSVMQTLQDWCMEDNRLVIMSIHQPRYSIFKLFDTLTLLSLGSVVYQGKASHVTDYFGRLGYGLEEEENPADFLLDILNDSQSAITLHRRTVRKNKPKEKLDLIEKFRNSEECAAIEACLEKAHPQPLPSVGRRFGHYLSQSCRKLPSNLATFFWQVCILVIRSTIANFRDPSSVLFQVLVMIGVSILISLIHLRLDLQTYDTDGLYILQRTGSFFFILLAQEFGVLSAFDLFISARSLFIHENGNGFYRVSSYFISKIISDIIPLRVIPTVILVVITYFMIGYQLKADKFFIYFLLLLLAAISRTSIAFAISAIVKNRSIAVVTYTMISISMILFSNILLSIDVLPPALDWLEYFSIYQHTVQSLTINEIAGQFYNATPTSISGQLVCLPQDGCVNGTALLEILNFRTEYSTLWASVGALFGFIVGFLAIAYILLRCSKKHK